MGAANNIIKCQDRVEQILRVSTEARQDDRVLWLAYMVNNHDLIKKIGLDAYRKLKSVMKDPNVPNMDTVGRLRRKLQSKGKYLTAHPVRRKYEMKKVKQALAYKES